MAKATRALVLCLLLGGCANFGYYAQMVGGQMQLMTSRRPISEIISDTATDPKLRQQLEQVSAIREFASHELALPKNGSYWAYADLGRPYVLWNVFAAPEFSVELQQWCFLFVGCVNYRGYFNKDNADRYAAKLRQEGADIYVGGVPAYSTLGYYNDPVLNTFLRFGDQEVARTIFHELAHQLVYAAGDSTFNESFATAVENEGMRRWLKQTARLEDLQNFETQQEHQAQIHRLVADSRNKLRAIYASTLASDAKRRAKSKVFEEMKQTYADLKSRWNGYGGYDKWFNLPMNNAILGSVALYTQWVPAFNALLEQEGGDLPHFYRRVAELAHLPLAKRSAALDHLMPSI